LHKEKNKKEYPNNYELSDLLTKLKDVIMTATNIQLIVEIKLKPLSDNTSVEYIHKIGPIDTPKLKTKVIIRKSKIICSYNCVDFSNMQMIPQNPIDIAQTNSPINNTDFLPNYFKR
jgi:hypothetical protein